MKKILTLLFVTLTAFAIVGCDHDDSKTVYEYENTTKTIFVYMPWTVNLTTPFDKNISSMENAINNNGSMKGTDVIVYKASSSSQAVMFRMKYNIT